MNLRRIPLILIVLGTLACNFLTSSLGVSTPAPKLPEPAYFPPECQNAALATIPPATALALPTPVLQANPEIGLELQQRVFDQLVTTVEDVYVYPDYNEVDRDGLKQKTREKIDSGLSTQGFYTEIRSMISDLGDQHSYLLSPVEVAASDATLAGSEEFGGIGVNMLPLVDKNRIALISVFPNSPADYAGIKPHDSILAADGIPIIKDGGEQVQLIRGPQCSAVVLTVQSPGGAPRDLMLVRQRIHYIQYIQTAMLPTSGGSRIGYISLPSFLAETIPGQVADALTKFGVLDGLIIDNRFNGGGDSRVFEPILSYFASRTLGKFASRTDSRPLTIEPDPIQNSQTVPLAILVSQGTVSLGEIFSGVLKDAGRAQIVGQLTLGNVELLQGYNFDDGSQLWLAAETFIAAHSKQTWEQTGIIPDVNAYADWDTFTFENDPGIRAALKLLGH